MKVIIICISLLGVSPGFSQETNHPAKEPKTKLESFEARTGAVIIKGYSQIGKVGGSAGASVTVDCRELFDAAANRKEYGITIEVKEGPPLRRQNTTLIDYDEIDSLLKGIDFISKIDKSVTSLSNFEAIYVTKGDFRVFTFSSSEAKIRAGISSGRIGATSAYLSLDDLAKLRGFIAQAKEKLDSIMPK